MNTKDIKEMEERSISKEVVHNAGVSINGGGLRESNHLYPSIRHQVCFCNRIRNLAFKNYNYDQLSE